LQLVSAIRGVRRRRYLGWIISLGALGACLMLRVYIQGYGDFLGSGAFMPAVMIAALFGGVAEGIIVFVLSGLILFFFYVPPYLTLEIERSRDAVGLVLFVVTGSIALYLIRTLNKAVDISHGLMEEAVVMQKRTATLFAELQHRVANNLAFLTAVLDRQTRQLGQNGPVPATLQSIKDRLMAMSHSHRRLYDPTKIDQPVDQYLREVCSEQIAMFGLPVTHTIDCDGIVLDLNHTVSITMIVSELVANCIKHGFKGRADGHIAISFRRSPKLNECVLIVSDNGCGISGTPDGKGGLGKTIINSLAAQLQAQITCENGNGTTVIVRFPMPEEQPNRSLSDACAGRRPYSAEKRRSRLVRQGI
jgi:two-component sensor histidine kinase